MNKIFSEFNILLDDFYYFVLDPSARYEKARLAVKEAVPIQADNLFKSIESTRAISKIATFKALDFPMLGLRALPARAQDMGQILLFHGISRSHRRNEIESWRDNQMILAGFERKLQISGILVLLGFIIELGSLFNQTNASSIVMTLLFGASLMGLGIFLFVYSLVA
jgi:hypothetical protein